MPCLNARSHGIYMPMNERGEGNLNGYIALEESGHAYSQRSARCPTRDETMDEVHGPPIHYDPKPNERANERTAGGEDEKENEKKRKK